MPHNDNHNPFAIDNLISINYDSVNPENTIYRIPIDFIGEVGTGMDGDGNGADLDIYLDLEYKVAKYNPSLDAYFNSIDLTSDFEPDAGETITTINEETFGRQIGASISDFGENFGGGQNTSREIELPTVRQLLEYYTALPENEIQGYELIECKIRGVYCRGNFEDTKVRMNIGGIGYPSADGPGVTEDLKYGQSYFEDNPDAEQVFTYFKEKYHILDRPDGYISGEQLPIGVTQLIDTNSLNGDNVLRIYDGEILVEEDEEITADIEEETETTTENENNVVEQISSNFGVPGLEQTLLRSIDAFSAISSSGVNIHNNLEAYFDENNKDKRIPLGLFFFDDDNIDYLNLPFNFSDEKFNQIENINLITNGDCKRIEKRYSVRAAGNDPSIAAKPAGGWHFLNINGVRFDIKKSGTSRQNIKEIDDTDLNYDQRISDSNDFLQSPNYSGGDNQLQTGYGGYYPYARLGEDLSAYFIHINATSLINTVALGAQGYAPFFVTRYSETLSDTQNKAKGKAPEIATWVDFSQLPDGQNKAFSNKRCLVFTSFSSWSSNTDVSEYYDFFHKQYPYVYSYFINSGLIDDSDYPSTDSIANYPSLPELYGTSYPPTENKYRVLNQTQKIYDATSDQINPASSLKIKFKMKTTVKNPNNTFPDVEVGILSRDLHDTSVPANSIVGTNNRDHFETKGAFNSSTYPNANFENQLSSNFGGLFKCNNFEENIWEDFEFDFKLNNSHINFGKVKSLNFFVQSGDQFSGQVMFDNFEVYESYDFYPDCDVRKKISVGNYGVGELTEYYDKTIPSQLQAYKDTSAPLEAQFYFYPRYPSEKILDVERTPIYQDFKKGLFYIYDIDWGDGSPKEFTTEPEQIDEEKALYHTYEESGVFEVTGYMLRLKADRDGEPIGLINNRKFKLRINVNEGLDEDFTYLNSDGFSFIPYKNTLPIIGGISKQSNYYKTIKRMLGFLDDDSRTSIKYQNLGTKLKLEKALLKMDDSFLQSFIQESNINPIGSIVPYFEQYGNINISAPEEHPEFNLIKNDDEFYINNLNFSNGSFEFISSYNQQSPLWSRPGDEGHPDGVASDMIILKLTAQQAQYFDFITGTEDLYQRIGFIGELNHQFIQTNPNFEIQESNVLFWNAEEGYYLTLDGQFDTNNLFKYFDSSEYKIGIKPNYNSTEVMYTDYGGQGTDGRLTFSNSAITQCMNFDIDGEGTHGINFDLFLNLFDDDSTESYNTRKQYMEQLSNLPFPKYFQEFDLTNSIDVNNLQNLFYQPNLDKWKNLGRFDVWAFLTTYGGAPEFFKEVGIDALQESIYDSYDPIFPREAQYLVGAQNLQLHPNNLIVPDESEITTYGYNPLQSELGKSLNDTDVTCIKYYNEPKSIWELFGVDNEIEEEVGTPSNEKYWKNIIPDNLSIFHRDGVVNLLNGDTIQWFGNSLEINENNIPNGINSIISEGQATTYNAVLGWVGNLTSLERGETYTFTLSNDGVYWNLLSLNIDTFSEQEWIDINPNHVNENQLYYYPVLPKYGADGKFIDDEFPNNKIPFPIQGPITDDNDTDNNLLISIVGEFLDNNVLDDFSGNENLGFTITDYKPTFKKETLQPLKRKNFQPTNKSKADGAF